MRAQIASDRLAPGAGDGMFEAFSLLPLVYVAWAEGSVSGPERRHILAAAHALGVRDETSAYDRLLGWLDERPDEQFFDEAFAILQRRLAAAEGGRESMAGIIADCLRVAEASGGVRGFVGTGSNVCLEEMEALDRVVTRLVAMRPGRRAMSTAYVSE